MKNKSKYETYTRTQLVEELKKLSKRKKYGLVWEEEKTKEIFEIDAIGKFPVLTEDKKREIKTSADKPTHILIEGDNYHALSVLNYTHAKNIDFIYIDPPYNTGKDDFVYNDKYVDSEDSYRHSKWLSFMYNRLLLAKKLLKNDGVIFISIDDNELSNLMGLCNRPDLFNETNFIGILIHKNNSSKNQAKLLSISTEYILVYAKNKKALINKKWRISKKGAKDIANMFIKLSRKGLSINEIHEQIKEMYSRPKYSHLSRWNKVDKDGVFADADLSREGGPTDYTIINPKTGKECIIPPRGWGKSYEELLQMQKDNLIWYGDEDTPPRVKDYIESEREMVPDNFLYFDNSSDTRLIKDMFGYLIFENPKPKDMIKHLISMAADTEAIILDFFAGSGTTAHAVHEINSEIKNANYQYIICTNNEVDKKNKTELEDQGFSKGMPTFEAEGICQKICYPRISKVILGYETKARRKIKGLKGNLKYFKTNFVNSEPTHRNKRILTDNSIELLCIKENTFDEVLSNPDYSIFKGKMKYTAILFNELKLDEFKREIIKLKLKVSVYVFTLEDDNLSEEFEDIGNFVTLCSIPEAILKVYRRIYSTINTK
jgi:DNA modification methylase